MSNGTHYVSPRLSQSNKDIANELLAHRCFTHDRGDSGYYRHLSLKAVNTKQGMRVSVDTPVYFVPIHYISDGPDREWQTASCVWHLDRAAEINDAYENACAEAKYVDGVETPYSCDIDFKISLERMVAPFELRWFGDRYPDKVMTLLNDSASRERHSKDQELGIEIGSVQARGWLGSCKYFAVKRPGFALINSCGQAWLAIHGPMPSAISHALEHSGRLQNLPLSKIFDAPFLEGADYRVQRVERPRNNTVFYFQPLRSTVVIPERPALSI